MSCLIRESRFSTVLTTAFHWTVCCWSHVFQIRFARSVAPLCVTVLCIGADVMGPGDAGGVAIRYGLDGPGIELRCGRDFLQPSRPALGSTQPPVQRVPCLCPWGIVAGAWPRPPTSDLAPRLKKKYSYTSNPPLGLPGLFYLNFTCWYQHDRIVRCNLLISLGSSVENL